MAKRATVAYENAREAKRKLRAVRPLRWHRMESEGRYEAKGERGRYVLLSRSPNRRKGIFPWTVLSGSLRGPEIKSGGFDLKADAATYAAQYDSGLCGQPAVVVQVPSPAGLPPGVYRGTAAEAKRTPYFNDVEMALKEMDAGGLGSESSSYVSSMEAAGVDPKITAAVLVATHQHRHDHNCVGKHVNLAEGGAEAREAAEHGHRRESHIFRGKRFDLFHAEGSWWYQLKDTGYGQGGYPSREAAMSGAQQALGMPSGFSMAVEEGGSKKFQAAKAALAAVGYSIQDTGWGDWRVFKKGAGPDEGYFTDDLDDAVATGQQMASGVGVAMESKKRLWQPDPGSGLWITKSSLNQAYFLMLGDNVLRVFNTRKEAEDEAKNLQGKYKLEAATRVEEGRRPKA